MTTRTRAAQLVDQIEAGLGGLTELMADPSSVPFDEVCGELTRLEDVVNTKAFIDAAFAWLAERSDAGRLVGSTRPTDYLIRKLKLSRREAYDRLGRGEALFTPPAVPPLPAAQPEPGETPEERRRREQESERIRREEQRRREQDLLAQEKARIQARNSGSAEKQRIIRQELTRLNDHADPSYAQLHALALEQSAQRTPEDLCVWLRHRVTNANAAGRRPDGRRDRLSGHKKRFLHLGVQDADGNVRITGQVPAYVAAKLTAALAPGLAAGVNASVPEELDKRTRGARAVDQLNIVLDRILADESGKSRQGVGSVVVSLTVDDVAEMTADSTYLSNTGQLLRPIDILNLGAAKFDLGVVHDTDGRVLALGRNSRSASMFQKIALFAQEALCTCGSCHQAMVHTQVHHLEPWARGGLTDVENLTLMCPPHHGDNNDLRNGAGGMGHMEKDSATGRNGWRPPDGGELHFNDTTLQEFSAGAKIRARGPAPAMAGADSTPDQALW